MATDFGYTREKLHSDIGTRSAQVGFTSSQTNESGEIRKAGQPLFGESMIYSQLSGLIVEHQIRHGHRPQWINLSDDIRKKLILEISERLYGLSPGGLADVAAFANIRVLHIDGEKTMQVGSYV